MTKTKKEVVKVDKKEEARIEEAAKVRAHDKDIDVQKEFEVNVKSLEGLKKRQTYLDDLLVTLDADGIGSRSDLELKLARVNQDVLVAEKKVK